MKGKIFMNIGSQFCFVFCFWEKWIRFILKTKHKLSGKVVTVLIIITLILTIYPIIFMSILAHVKPQSKNTQIVL